MSTANQTFEQLLQQAAQRRRLQLINQRKLLNDEDKFQQSRKVYRKLERPRLSRQTSFTDSIDDLIKPEKIITINERLANIKRDNNNILNLACLPQHQKLTDKEVQKVIFLFHFELISRF